MILGVGDAFRKLHVAFEGAAASKGRRRKLNCSG